MGQKRLIVFLHSELNQSFRPINGPYSIPERRGRNPILEGVSGFDSALANRSNDLSPGQRNAQKCQGNKRQDKDHKKDQLQICDGISGALQPVFAIGPFLCPTARHHGFVTSPINSLSPSQTDLLEIFPS